MTGNADLVVLGAGPAGLAAAWRAARRGLSVDVLERAETVGGMAASFDVAGFRVDFGSHRLNPDLPEHILTDLRTLMGSDLQTRYRNGRLLVGDRWVTYPFKPRELAKSMPAVPMARAAFDALATTWRGKKQTAAADSYAELMRAGFGPTMYKQVYEPYAAKLWGVSGEEIDIDQARRKAGSQSMWSALVRSVRNSIASESLAYLYPRRGFGQLCESLADAAMQAGVRIRLGAAAEHLSVDTQGVSVTLARSEFHSAAAERGGWSGEQHWADGGSDIRAGHVFSTIPVPLLARLTSPGAPYEALEASGKLRFRAILLVYAVHAGGRWTDCDVHYIPDGDTPVTRISEPANHRFSPDDPTGRTVLCFEIPCDIGDDLWAADEDQLANLVRQTVRQLGLPQLKLEWVQVKRMRQVYPIYHKGYREALADLETWVGSLPHVTTFGRLGLFTPDNTHHALMMGYEAADALGTGQWDERMWSEARDRFTRHVVES